MKKKKRLKRKMNSGSGICGIIPTSLTYICEDFGTKKNKA